MYYFYIVIFLVGVLYTFVSLIISGISGAFHSHGDFGADLNGHTGDTGGHGHIDAGHIHADVNLGHMHANAHIGHGHTAGNVDAGHHAGDLHGQHGQHGDTSGSAHSIISWFAILINPLVAVSFLTVFGGLGIMGVKFFKWNSIVVFIFAFAAAVLVATVLYNFVAKPIYRSENTSDVSREKLIGTPAEVTTDILSNGYGTIKYTVNSIKYTGPAKHIEDKPVKQGEKVFICKIDNNTFYVSELSEVIN